MSALANNTTSLQSILATINTLPSAGTELPELSNPASASHILNTYEAIDDSGEVITGTMTDNGAISETMDGINTKTVAIPAGYTSGGSVALTDDIDNAVATEADLISQIATALEGKAGGSGGGESGTDVETCTISLTTDNRVHRYGCTTCVDGVILSVYKTAAGLADTTTFTQDNVVVGSCVVVVTIGTTAASVENLTQIGFASADIDGIMTLFFKVEQE